MSEKPPAKSEDYKPDRRNAQGAHHGSKHRPEEFETELPARDAKHSGETEKT